MRKLLVALFGLLIMSAPAGAQDKPVSINIGAGVLMPLSGLNDAFDTGGERWDRRDVQCVADFRPSGGVHYNWMPGPEKTILVSPDPGRNKCLVPVDREQSQHSFGHVQRHLRVAANREGWRIRHRWPRLLSSDGTQLTSPAVGYTNGLRSVLGPWCYPAAVSVDNILVDRLSNDFGINLGGGVTFGGESAKFYAEFRYHYVWGPEVRAQGAVVSGGPCEQGCSTNAQYSEINFGVRF